MQNVIDLVAAFIGAWFIAGSLIGLIEFMKTKFWPWCWDLLCTTGQRIDRVLGLTILSNEERRITATHEAGHAVATLVLCPDILESLEASQFKTVDGSSGEMRFFPSDRKTRRSLVEHIVIDYAGLTAEDLVLGDHDDGCKDDLENASRRANHVACFFGADTTDTPISYEILIGELGLRCQEIEGQRLINIVRILRSCHKQAESILIQERALLDAITEALLKKGQLDREELLALHATHASKKA